jgi:hypothetical protein
MESRICQNCGIPMKSAEEFGTNKGGNRSQDYCIYCFKNVDFNKQETRI